MTWKRQYFGPGPVKTDNVFLNDVADQVESTWRVMENRVPGVITGCEPDFGTPGKIGVKAGMVVTAGLFYQLEAQHMYVPAVGVGDPVWLYIDREGKPAYTVGEPPEGIGWPDHADEPIEVERSTCVLGWAVRGEDGWEQPRDVRRFVRAKPSSGVLVVGDIDDVNEDGHQDTAADFESIQQALDYLEACEMADPKRRVSRHIVVTGDQTVTEPLHVRVSGVVLESGEHTLYNLNFDFTDPASHGYLFHLHGSKDFTLKRISIPMWTSPLTMFLFFEVGDGFTIDYCHFKPSLNPANWLFGAVETPVLKRVSITDSHLEAAVVTMNNTLTSSPSGPLAQLQGAFIARNRIYVPEPSSSSFEPDDETTYWPVVDCGGDDDQAWGNVVEDNTIDGGVTSVRVGPRCTVRNNEITNAGLYGVWVDSSADPPEPGEQTPRGATVVSGNRVTLWEEDDPGDPVFPWWRSAVRLELSHCSVIDNLLELNGQVSCGVSEGPIQGFGAESEVPAEAVVAATAPETEPTNPVDGLAAALAAAGDLATAPEADEQDVVDQLEQMLRWLHVPYNQRPSGRLVLARNDEQQGLQITRQDLFKHPEHPSVVVLRPLHDYDFPAQTPEEELVVSVEAVLLEDVNWPKAYVPPGTSVVLPDKPPTNLASATAGEWGVTGIYDYFREPIYGGHLVKGNDISFVGRRKAEGETSVDPQSYLPVSGFGVLLLTKGNRVSNNEIALASCGIFVLDESKVGENTVFSSWLGIVAWRRCTVWSNQVWWYRRYVWGQPPPADGAPVNPLFPGLPLISGILVSLECTVEANRVQALPYGDFPPGGQPGESPYGRFLAETVPAWARDAEAGKVWIDDFPAASAAMESAVAAAESEGGTPPPLADLPQEATGVGEVSKALEEAAARTGIELPAELTEKIAGLLPSVGAGLDWMRDPAAVNERIRALEGLAGWAPSVEVSGRDSGLAGLAAAVQVPWTVYLPLLSPAVLIMDIPLLMLAAAYLSQPTKTETAESEVDGGAPLDPLGPLLATLDAMNSQKDQQPQLGPLWRTLMSVLDAAWLFVNWGQDVIAENWIDIYEEHKVEVEFQGAQIPILGVQLNSGIVSSAGMVGPPPDGFGWFQIRNYYPGHNVISSDTVVGGAAGYLTISPDVVTGCTIERGAVFGAVAGGVAGPAIEGCHVSGRGLRVEVADNWTVPLFAAVHLMEQAAGSSVSDSVLRGKGLWTVLAGCDRVRIHDCRIEGDHESPFAGIGIVWLGDEGSSVGCEFKCDGKLVLPAGSFTFEIPVPFPAIFFEGLVFKWRELRIYWPRTQGNLVAGAQMSFCWPYWQDNDPEGQIFRSPIWNYGHNPMPAEYEEYDDPATPDLDTRWTNRVHWESCWYWRAGQEGGLLAYLVDLLVKQLIKQL